MSLNIIQVPIKQCFQKHTFVSSEDEPHWWTMNITSHIRMKTETYCSIEDGFFISTQKFNKPQLD
jgi:hypothetical protein